MSQTKTELRELVLEVVRTLGALLEEKDPFLKKHSERVANNSANFCEEYKIAEADEVEEIYLAGMLHDIGIVAVPNEILHRSDPLDDDEMIKIKRHPVSGEKILSNFSLLQSILPTVRHHHEAYDGSGYPDGLNGENIPLGARVLALFNHLDNLVFPRFSENALSVADALEDINSKAGQQFDSQLINNFNTFTQSKGGDSEDFMLKREMAAMRAIFSAILQKFQAGKLNPPVMPQVVREIQAVMKRPRSTADQMAQVIEKDPVISLRLISVANSPIYRGVSEIQNVKSALPRLGLKEALNIVMAITNKSLYTTDKAQFKILMDKLWVHSLASAYAAKLIAQEVKHSDSEKMFLMGLTHDIGKILLLKAFTEISNEKDLNMKAVTINLQEAHLSLGNLLLKRWGFDDEFLKVLTHHDDKVLSPDSAKEIVIVHLANVLTRKIGFSLFDDDSNFAELDSVQILQVNPERVEDIGENVKEIISDVAHLF